MCLFSQMIAIKKTQQASWRKQQNISVLVLFLPPSIIYTANVANTHNKESKK